MKARVVARVGVSGKLTFQVSRHNFFGLSIWCTNNNFDAALSNFRRHPDSNWGMEVLQTSALPLGYAAIKKSGKRDSNSRQPPWQGGALPTELFPHTFLIIYRKLYLSTSFQHLFYRCC